MNSILNPEVLGGAYDRFLVDAMPRARTQRPWTPEDGPLPELYLSHGAPPLVYDFGGFHPRYCTMRYDTPDATAPAGSPEPCRTANRSTSTPAEGSTLGPGCR
jgi:4,5-DOPA dioxygenase extradiol